MPVVRVRLETFLLCTCALLGLPVGGSVAYGQTPAPVVMAVPTAEAVQAAQATPAPQAPAQAAVPAVQATRTEANLPIANAAPAAQKPVIDGQLNEADWQKAPALTNFTQAEPLEGQPASENTEVRILYDDDAIYVGAWMHDRDPSLIVTTDTRRDANLDQMDSFQIIFDTFRDRQNGFVFGTNALGVQYDAQVRNQSNPEANWDGSWDVKTNVTDTGWTAEFRIPLRTLRYGSDTRAWGVNAFRNIQRTRERTYWAPLARIFTFGRLSSAGELRGLQLKTPRNFKILPYAISSAARDYRPQVRSDMNGDFGIDAKIGLTPSLNLDATYNTDFAQVEVDNQQINLTRFNLRFPEKRPFFLENSALFTVGKGNEIDLFFSRRIGLDEDGGIVPIKGGGRVSGKVGRFNVGGLNMQTSDAAGRAGNNFGMMRVSRELPNRSGLGAIFVNRQGVGSLARTNDYNRTYGLDGRFGIGEFFTTSGFLARTQTPGLTRPDHAYNVDTTYDDGKHQAGFEYGETGEDFNPEVGFLETPGGYKRTRVRYEETLRQQRIRDWGFRELLPHVNYTRYDFRDGGLLTADLHVDNHWDWESGHMITVAINGTWDGLREPFEVYPGVIVPVGEHGGLRTTFRYNSDRRKRIYGQLNWDYGRFLTGMQSSPRIQIILRDSGRFAVDTTWTYREIDLPEGSFHTNLGNMRVTYNFSPSVFVQSLLQYNDRTNRWSTNLRFHWLQTAGTGLFVVYNNTEGLNGIGPVNRTFIIKYAHQLDILR